MVRRGDEHAPVRGVDCGGELVDVIEPVEREGRVPPAAGSEPRLGRDRGSTASALKKILSRASSRWNLYTVPTSCSSRSTSANRITRV